MNISEESPETTHDWPITEEKWRNLLRKNKRKRLRYGAKWMKVILYVCILGGGVSIERERTRQKVLGFDFEGEWLMWFDEGDWKFIGEEKERKRERHVEEHRILPWIRLIKFSTGQIIVITTWWRVPIECGEVLDMDVHLLN